MLRLRKRVTVVLCFTLFMYFTSYGQIVLTKTNGGVSWQTLPSIGTDDQNITGSGLSGTNLTIGIENGGSQTVNLVSLRDGTGTDNQNISGSGLSGTNLTIGIEGGSNQTVNLVSLRDGTGTDNQNIAGCALNGTNLTIGIQRGASQTINLASLTGSSTDDQNIRNCALHGTNLTIGIENGMSKTVSLVSLKDGNGIYSGSGTASGNTTVSFNGSTLTFNPNGRIFRVGIITVANGRVGISHSNPTHSLHLGADAAAKPSTSTWTINSDARLKNVVESYDKGLQEVLQLNPITYHYKDVGNRVFKKEVKETLSIGFTAQEVRKVFPECVSEEKDGYLSLDLHAVNVAYANAIKELHRLTGEYSSEIKQLSSEAIEFKKYVKQLQVR